MAAAICPYCEKAIGYGVRFYNLDSQYLGDESSSDDVSGYVHALCHEKHVEARR